MRRSIVRVSGVGKGRKKALRSGGLQRRVEDLDARVELIQALIPLGLEAVQSRRAGTAAKGSHSIGRRALPPRRRATRP